MTITDEINRVRIVLLKGMKRMQPIGHDLIFADNIAPAFTHLAAC
jgi:hypothetical protein